MRISRVHAHLVAAFAEDKKIGRRQAQDHRKKESPSWRTWLAARAAGAPAAPCMVLLPPGENGGGGGVDIAAAEETGLSAEVQRLQSETRALAVEIATMPQSDIAGRMALMRMLDEKRKTLRECSRDLSSILSSIGDVIPAAAVVRYCATLKGIICTLPPRIATLVPAELAADLRARIQVEIDRVLETCATITLQNQ